MLKRNLALQILSCCLTASQASLQSGRPQQLPLGSDAYSQKPSLPSSRTHNGKSYGSFILSDLLSSLDVMQTNFFEVWQGGWPDSIDWTGAVLGTYVSTALNTLTRSVESGHSPISELSTEAAVENTIARYFTQTTSYYYSQNAFGIRLQAHDDMMWVVLGWLDSIKFANLHNDLHHLPFSRVGQVSASHSDLANSSWFGKQFETAHAHRAHVFYDIVHKAWDPKLCGGGLTWNPRLDTYKNAITNEQYVSTSIAMYLYHPGDTNTSPFMQATGPALHTSDGFGLDPLEPHSPKLLKAAIDAYDWLVAVNMTDADGLYVDGYHISDDGKKSKSGVRQCDDRNEMVYTYNQGVVLSGLRDLWEATGNTSYLADGHELIQNVIKATGWIHRTPEDAPDSSNDAIDELNVQWQRHLVDIVDKDTGQSRTGKLGTDGILTEDCDVGGTCSQDAQTFKGIFFTHMSSFCSRLPVETPLIEGITHLASRQEAEWHRRHCAAYAGWVAWNAEHALQTRNDKGVFGMWWGASRRPTACMAGGRHPLPEGAVDVRNEGIPRDSTWLLAPAAKPMPKHDPLERSKTVHHEQGSLSADCDANDRGRGRTVETQGGGLAVVRAWWELWDLTQRPTDM